MKLCIIGNGFDPNHGLPTSYWHYRNYLVANNSSLVSNYEYHEHLRATVCSVDTKWDDVEDGLLINYEDAFDAMASYYPDMNSERTPDWDGINIETENRVAFLGDFMGRFYYDWLMTINQLCGLVSPKYALNPLDAYINFNYTRTLEIAYRVPDTNVFHIHGMVGTPESIQFGNPSNNPQDMQAELESRYSSDEFFSVVYDPAISSMGNYAANAFKDISANIGRLRGFVAGCALISEVVIMGHALMGIDDPYYSQVLLPNYRNCMWKIYVHNEDDANRAAIFIKQNQIGQSQLVP